MKRLILILLSLLWVTMAPAGAKTLGERWTKNMREARAHLQAGDWRAGRNVAEKLVQSMTEEITGGPDAAKTLAMALTLQAVGEAGTGDLDAAIWHWQVAQGLAPEAVTDELLAGLGTAGTALRAHPPRPVGKMLDGSAPTQAGADPVPPKLDGLEDFPMPRKLASMWRLHTVEIEILVDEQGKPAAPVIVRSSLPGKTYQLLEHARTRTFRAGTLAGRPVTSVASYSLSAAKGYLPKVRSLLAADDVTTARCLYRGLQGIDPSIEAADVEDALRTVDAREQATRTEGESTPLHVGGDVSPPRPLRAPAPEYSDRARTARDQGVVILQTIIDRAGNVRQPRLLKPLVQDLDLQAILGVCQWRFQPATLNGQPVDVYHNLTVNFRLK